MALTLADDTVDRFVQITRFDLRSYINQWTAFVSTDYQKIIDYYKGDVDMLDENAVKNLNEVEQKAKQLSDILYNTDMIYDRDDFWNLIDYLDNIRARIRVTRSISKFLRTTRYPGFEESSLSVNYQVSDYDTPESIAAIDRETPNDTWADIYLKNHKLETDYQAETGGYNLVLGKRQLNNLFIEAVIDNLSGDNIYGKDIDKMFVYENDDIKVLTPRQTAVQSIEQLATLSKGEIPEYADLGVSEDIRIGSNIGAINVPFIVREMKEAFSTDDTLLGFGVANIKREETTLFNEFSIETFHNFVVNSSIAIK